MTMCRICASNVSCGSGEIVGDLCIKRQGADKGIHNVDDISKVLDKVDPEAIPIYVARDIGKLPSINHVDMSTLPREITACKSKICGIEMSHQTLFDSVSALSTQIFTLLSSLLLQRLQFLHHHLHVHLPYARFFLRDLLCLLLKEFHPLSRQLLFLLFLH